MNALRPVAAPAQNQGVTITEIEEWLTERGYHQQGVMSLRASALLFAILKEGTSIQKLEDFTSYPREVIGAFVDSLNARGHLFTGAVGVQYVLQRVPNSEELIERITGQRFNHKKEPAQTMPKVELKAAPKPKKPYKRGPYKKHPTGDGTLRLKHPAGDGASDGKCKVKFSIVYIDSETRFERSGDSMEKLLAALEMVKSFNEKD